MKNLYVMCPAPLLLSLPILYQHSYSPPFPFLSQPERHARSLLLISLHQKQTKTRHKLFSVFTEPGDFEAMVNDEYSVEGAEEAGEEGLAGDTIYDDADGYDDAGDVDGQDEFQIMDDVA